MISQYSLFDMEERGYQHLQWQHKDDYLMHDQALPGPSAPPAPLPVTGFGTLESNLQPPVARENAPLLPYTPEVNATTKVFSLEKFVFLWLGIGHKYWGLCLVVFLLLYAVGIVTIIWSALFLSFWPYSNPDLIYNCDYNLQQNYILCLLSGVLFLLIGSYWPIAYCWKIRQGRNFKILGCYLCVLSVLIVSCVAALIATMAFVATMFGSRCFDSLSLGASITMGLVILIFLCGSSVFFYFYSNKISRIY